MRCAAGIALLACIVATAPAGRASGNAVPPCRATELGGSFTGVYGSSGMGHVEYRLRLVNLSPSDCLLSSLPRLRLLGRSGSALPTTIHPGRGSPSPTVVIPSHQTAFATALFSPDIPGPGDTHAAGRPCQPTAFRLAVPAAGGAAVVPVEPPTSVCERGSLLLARLAVPAIPAALWALIRATVARPASEYVVGVQVDPEDASWVAWAFGPAGPADRIQGGIAFAHRTGGRWRDAYGPASAGFCGAHVPRAVLESFGIPCPG